MPRENDDACSISTRHPEVRAISALTRVFDALWRASKETARVVPLSGAVVLRGPPVGGRLRMTGMELARGGTEMTSTHRTAGNVFASH
jgi:hypothetical protein